MLLPSLILYENSHSRGYILFIEQCDLVVVVVAGLCFVYLQRCNAVVGVQDRNGLILLSVFDTLS